MSLESKPLTYSCLPQEAKKRLAIAEKEMFDVTSNPYFLNQESIDELTMEIEELKIFSVEVRKVLSGGSSSVGVVGSGGGGGGGYYDDQGGPMSPGGTGGRSRTRHRSGSNGKSRLKFSI